MAKFETVPLAELKTRLPAKLMPLVEEYKAKLEKLGGDQGGRLTLEKGDDLKDLRRVLKAAAAALSRRVRFPFRGEGGVAQLLPREGTGEAGQAPEGRGGGSEEEARQAEEGEQLGWAGGDGGKAALTGDDNEATMSLGLVGAESWRW